MPNTEEIPKQVHWVVEYKRNATDLLTGNTELQFYAVMEAGPRVLGKQTEGLPHSRSDSKSKRVGHGGVVGGTSHWK